MVQRWRTNGPWPGGGIAVDQVGDAYVTGSTYAIDFPITSFPFQPLYAGNGDAFVTKFPIGTPYGISISGIVPNAGGNAGQVTPEIVGTGFHLGATTQLNCGVNQVPGTNVTISANGQILQATFDLTSSSPGTCDVVVTNPDQTSAKLGGGFTVQQGGAPNIQVQKIGTLAIKGDNPPINVTYQIVASNLGNIDVEQHFLSEVSDVHSTVTSVDPQPAAETGLSILWQLSLGAKESLTFVYSATIDQDTPVGTQLQGGPTCDVPPDKPGSICGCIATGLGSNCADERKTCTACQKTCVQSGQACDTAYCNCTNEAANCLKETGFGKGVVDDCRVWPHRIFLLLTWQVPIARSISKISFKVRLIRTILPDLPELAPSYGCREQRACRT